MKADVLDFSERKNSVLGRVPGCGSMRFCSECRQFILHFGTVMMKLSPRGLLEMNRLIEGLVDRVHERGFPPEPIKISIARSPAALVVGPNQLHVLEKLVRYGLEIATFGADTVAGLDGRPN